MFYQQQTYIGAQVCSMVARAITRWCCLALLTGAALSGITVMAAPAVPGPTLEAADSPVETTTLYDGARGGTPDAQGFTYLVGANAARQTFESGATTLDTMALTGDIAGYFADAQGFFASPVKPPALKRSDGFTVTFTIQIEAESHAGSDRNKDNIDDRAGFSVIVLGDDTRGIELGFWEDQVWAQHGGVGETLFTHAEGAAFDTTARLITYHLVIAGESYTLYAGEAAILAGPLRDYTAFNEFPDPYQTPNFIFLGDDTRSARARTRISYVAASVPAARSDRHVYLPGVTRP